MKSIRVMRIMALAAFLALPLVALFALGSYMHAFAAWYKIREVMIAPAEESAYEESEAEAE